MKNTIRQNKGITLIALVITIIVLLILAGITIATLTGENGILDRAQQTRKQNDCSQADERVSLAYMAVKTEISTQKAINGTYDATEEPNKSTILNIVKKDLNSSEWKNPEPAYDGNTIKIRYNSTSLKKDGISKGKPAHDGYIDYKIVISAKDATLINTEDNDDNTGDTDVDPYRGLASSEEVVQDLFFYYELTDPTASNPGTAAINGINLEYILENELGDNIDEWPTFEHSSVSGKNSAYINAMKKYINKLVIPTEVTLNGKEYKITRVNNVFYSPYAGEDIEPIFGDYGSNYWGNATDLFGSEDLTCDLIVPNGIVSFSAGNNQGSSSCLKSVELPDGITELGAAAFAGCSSLTSLKLPASITSVDGWYVFEGCSSLNSLTLGPSFDIVDDYYTDFGPVEKIYLDSEVAVSEFYAGSTYVQNFLGNHYDVKVYVNSEFYDSQKSSIEYEISGWNTAYVFEEEKDNYAIYSLSE